MGRGRLRCGHSGQQWLRAARFGAPDAPAESQYGPLFTGKVRRMPSSRLMPDASSLVRLVVRHYADRFVGGQRRLLLINHVRDRRALASERARTRANV